MAEAIIADTSADDTRIAPEIITRAEAKARGLKNYFTGKPCKCGHVAERNTSNSHCLECRSAYYKTWREANSDKVKVEKKTWYEANLEKVKAQKKTYRETNREMVRARKKTYRDANQEKIKTHYKAWREANADRLKASSKARRDANLEEVRAKDRARNKVESDRRKTWEKARYKTDPGRVKARVQAWRKANPDKKHDSDAVRRARKLGQIGVVTRGIRAKLRKLQKGKCANCLASLEKAGEHLDHIVSLAKGGLHEDKNLQLLCQPCNNRKHAKDPIAFAREEGRLL